MGFVQKGHLKGAQKGGNLGKASSGSHYLKAPSPAGPSPAGPSPAGPLNLQGVAGPKTPGFVVQAQPSRVPLRVQGVPAPKKPGAAKELPLTPGLSAAAKLAAAAGPAAKLAAARLQAQAPSRPPLKLVKAGQQLAGGSAGKGTFVKAASVARTPKEPQPYAGIAPASVASVSRILPLGKGSMASRGPPPGKGAVVAGGNTAAANDTAVPRAFQPPARAVASSGVGVFSRAAATRGMAALPASGSEAVGVPTRRGPRIIPLARVAPVPKAHGAAAGDALPARGEASARNPPQRPSDYLKRAAILPRRKLNLSFARRLAPAEGAAQEWGAAPGWVAAKEQGTAQEWGAAQGWTAAPERSRRGSKGAPRGEAPDRDGDEAYGKGRRRRSSRGEASDRDGDEAYGKGERRRFNRRRGRRGRRRDDERPYRTRDADDSRSPSRERGPAPKLPGRPSSAIGAPPSNKRPAPSTAGLGGFARRVAARQDRDSAWSAPDPDSDSEGTGARGSTSSSKGKGKGKEKGDAKGKSRAKGDAKNKGEAKGDSKGRGTSKGDSKGKGASKGDGKNKGGAADDAPRTGAIKPLKLLKLVKAPAFQGKGGAYERPGEEAVGQSLQRTRVTQAPIMGDVLEWKGRFGWVQPHVVIDHPLAWKHGRRLRVRATDLVNQWQEVQPGQMCYFHVFSDANGLGAEEVAIDEDA